jgi:O-antigen/teichoic acid export membrane protein
LSIPLALGLAATAETFVPWFFTLDFAKSGEIMVVISPIIILIAWSNVLGQQFLLPTGQVRGFTLSVSSAAIVNFILNLCLIPYLQSVGTAIATVVAELSVTFLQFYFVKDQVRVRELFQSSWKYFISGLVMYGIIKGVTLFFPAKLFTTVLQVVIGVPVYFIMLFILKSQTNKFIFSKIFSIIAKKSKRG